MGNKSIVVENGEEIEEENYMYTTFVLGDQTLGVTVDLVESIMKPDMITSVPRSCDEVYGLLNLRGRIVTVVDTRKVMGLPDANKKLSEMMCLTVSYEQELYALLIDSIEEVEKFPKSSFSPVPRSVDENWRELSTGIHKTDNGILLILDVAKVMSFVGEKDK